MRTSSLTTLLLWIFLPIALSAQTSGDIIVEDLTLHISNSWTAQVFHITDQLSNWSPYTHRQYIRWAKKRLHLTADDSIMLSRYVVLRKAHTHNSDDFDHSFLVDGSIEQAAAAAVDQNRLSESEAKQAQEVLQYFSSRLSILRDTATSQVDRFYKRYAAHRQEMEPFLKKVIHFTESQGKISIPVFLVVNPEEGSGGGEANGGRLVVELQQKPDPLVFLVHESFHQLLRPHQEALKAMADSANVDWQVINEGMAYAIEGLMEDPDLLPNLLVHYIADGRTTADPYVRFYMAAILFRPMLREALTNGETVSAFLPKAIARWKSLSRSRESH
jgi:hypothetical protein